MTTTGATLFNMDLSEIIEDAFERCGSEARSGYDFKTARRSLNLLLIEWGSRGINLWTVEEGSILLNTGVATYNLPIDTVDLLDHVIRTGSGQNQSDITISRISGSTYSTIPNKTAMGKPIQVWSSCAVLQLGLLPMQFEWRFAVPAVKVPRKSGGTRSEKQFLEFVPRLFLRPRFCWDLRLLYLGTS